MQNNEDRELNKDKSETESDFQFPKLKKAKYQKTKYHH